MKNKPIFVTGIDTGIGKTVVSAILVEKLQADYWKPIQSGDLHRSDTMTVKSLVSNPRTRFHPEAYRLTQPFSPHKSARLDSLEISLDEIQLPSADNHLIIEGAGGLMVPLNDRDLMTDLIPHLGAEVILVSKNYLGSINHTLLSLEVLRSKNIPLKGIIFNGPRDKDSESIILRHSGATCLGYLPQLPVLTPASITAAAEKISL